VALIGQPDSLDLLTYQSGDGETGVHERHGITAAVGEGETAILGVFFLELVSPCAFEVNRVGEYQAGHVAEYVLGDQFFDLVIGLGSHP